MSGFLIILAILLLLLFLSTGFMYYYNRLVRAHNMALSGWSQISIQLQRRHDLIPNLVATVQGYAQHEENVLSQVTQARTEAIKAIADSPEIRYGKEYALEKSIPPLLAIAEDYPILKASNNFLQLQQELVGSEDRISAARRIYNTNVMILNNYLQTIPSKWVGKTMKIQSLEYYGK